MTREERALLIAIGTAVANIVELGHYGRTYHRTDYLRAKLNDVTQLQHRLDREATKPDDSM